MDRRPDPRTARRWIVDPIDGTTSYLRGIPIWATLLALEVDGQVDLALVSAPALGRRWWARRGGGAFTDRGRCRVSEVSQIEDAAVSTTSQRRMPQPLIPTMSPGSRVMVDFASCAYRLDGSEFPYSFGCDIGQSTAKMGRFDASYHEDVLEPMAVAALVTNPVSTACSTSPTWR